MGRGDGRRRWKLDVQVTVLLLFVNKWIQVGEAGY